MQCRLAMLACATGQLRPDCSSSSAEHSAAVASVGTTRRYVTIILLHHTTRLYNYSVYAECNFAHSTESAAGSSTNNSSVDSSTT
jgi:hypothetical protein